MAKKLGLDLGTNSIGWAIRESDVDLRRQFLMDYKSYNEETDKDKKTLNNEFVDYGVVIFKKGVGDGKNGEFSLAAERRTNRSKRRLYNAKRYRKWELLKILIENNMCPLTLEELRLWSIGNWKQLEGKYKNSGRIYPIKNEFFQQWLAFDPTFFGQKGISNNNNLIRKNPYDLRCELLENEEENDNLKKLKTGRAFYHLVQRRGFKSSRKSGQSAYAKNEDIEKLKSEKPDFQISILAKNKLDNGERFRSSGVIQRKYFEDEFYAICRKQNLSNDLTEKLHNAIYFVRPLRSQKGLVGNCTLEKGKPRIPISHPKFEEFRALQFINNIKWRENGKKEFIEIPMLLKKKIFEELFFRKLEKGQNKGKISLENYFKFEEIIKDFSENGLYEFNYRNLPNVSTCPTIAALMNIFDTDWSEKFIQDKNKIGINWDGLQIKYTPKYGKIKRKIKDGKKLYVNKDFWEKTLRIDDIWHLLFDYIQTNDNAEKLEKFCTEVLGFDENKAKAFSSIDIPQGYGSLSYKAISNILPFLRDGIIYSEAVLFANLKKALGPQFEEKKEQAKIIITKTIKETGEKKELLNITNGLIQNFFADTEMTHAKGFDDIIKEMAWHDTTNKLKKHFGENDWNKKTETEKKTIENEVLTLYLRFLNGEQSKDEKASAKNNKEPDIDYYKIPRLDEAIKLNLKSGLNLDDKNLKYLYHPSDIEMYPASKTEKEFEINGYNHFIKLLESPQPPSKGWKNPMAMRTLHELRHLLNYLLKIGKIDKDTKIIVEMARELNTKNYRKAYSNWTKDKDNENINCKKSILELYGITDPSINDYNKYRIAVEQIINHELSENKNPIFYHKYNNFIETYLKTISISDKNKDILMSDEFYDYLMYLILNRDEFRKMLNFKIPNTSKWYHQLISTSFNFDKKRKELLEMLLKYRLWKEQKFQCFYTGQYISLTQLFSANYQIEHTIPRSISFDSELKNVTVCDSIYNSQVKKNCFPTDCLNYYEMRECKTVNGVMKCSPIKERVDKNILPKVKELYTRIKNLEVINIGLIDEEKRNANIQLRHYLQFELEYWEKKLITFTITKDKWKDKWKNSQLTDTQIISKYARAYLKTVFEKVDVQKGTVTNVFKKIYQIKGDEQKDRSKHSHHAVDAAVLTLIPGSAIREAILKEYYKAEENMQKYHTIPYEKYISSHVHDIENNILINHIVHNKTLTATLKNIRKRGNKTGKTANGDSIKGQLHEETYLGAIKPNIFNVKGKAIKDSETGKYLNKQINGDDVIWVVQRKNINDVDIDAIVDEALKNHIKSQLANKIEIKDVKDFADKQIRHIRFKKFSPSYDKTLKVKSHTYSSKYKHKLLYLTNNDSNYLCLFYKGVDNRNREIKAFKFINLFEFSNLENKKISSLSSNPKYNVFIKINRNNEFHLYLTNIINVGQKVIMYKDSIDEIARQNLVDLSNKIYRVYKFNNSGTDYIFLQNIIEARNDDDLKKAGYKTEGETEYNPSKYQPRLKLSADNLNCLFENIDFEIKPDGTINWKSDNNNSTEEPSAQYTSPKKITVSQSPEDAENSQLDYWAKLTPEQRFEKFLELMNRFYKFVKPDWSTKKIILDL
ncbi:MAG TPA: HNH endonuclease domain-containing protein [Bacteroidales bacterium]|nr:HNH endonuclease domain-containing protein [Bacteroidales bacterium]